MLKPSIILAGICAGLAALVIGIFVFYSYFDPFPPNERLILGVSFSPEYARFLGLDYQQAFAAAVGELGFKRLRLSAQWNTVEPKVGEFNFTELDWLMSQAERRQLKVILAMGQKTPRWPECHLPEWVKSLPHQERIQALYKYVEAVVGRYKNNQALELWQVENEPFLGFGICPEFTKADFTGELSLVKRLDPARPTLTSDSGELSSWRQTARAADYFGTTLYRVVWNRVTGYWSYDWLPAVFYRAKLRLAGRSADTAFVTELQGEPWIPYGNALNTSITEQFKSMNLQRLQNNIAYARRLGLPRAYLWGVEWWVWLERQGEGEMGDYVKSLPKE